MRVQVPWAETKPIHRYFNDLVRCTCFPDMLATGIYPNAKELTESAAAYDVVRSRVRCFDLRDPVVTVVCVGDGRTPRTAAMFAFRSAWACMSVDPLLKVKNYKVERLYLYPERVEEMGMYYFPKLVLVAVHSHARLQDACHHFRAQERIVIAIPCCVPQQRERPADLVYEDNGIWSPQNKVYVWHDKEQ